MDGSLDSGTQFYAVFLREKLNIKLAFIFIAVGQGDKDAFSSFLCSNVNPMVAVAVGSS